VLVCHSLYTQAESGALAMNFVTFADMMGMPGAMAMDHGIVVLGRV
jgi:hypothetical protein